MTQDEVISHFGHISAEKDTVFTDIDQFPWAKNPIEKLASLGIVNGAGNGLFLPESTVSRYEFIKMITGVCGIVNKNANAPHTDLSKDHWAYIYVASAHEAGLLDIYSKIILNGNAPITREEMAYIGANALVKNGCLAALSKSAPDFTDTNKMSDFSPEAVATLCDLGVINGRGDGTFCPKDYATRAESAKIIYNILNIVENNF
jgi:hypothetical protein